MVNPTTFTNSSDVIGLVLVTMTNDVTGSIFLTLFYFTILLTVLCLGVGLPLEWTAIFVLPVAIASLAYYDDYLQIGGFALLYLGIVFAKNWVGSKY